MKEEDTITRDEAVKFASGFLESIEAQREQRNGLVGFDDTYMRDFKINLDSLSYRIGQFEHNDTWPFHEMVKGLEEVIKLAKSSQFEERADQLSAKLADGIKQDAEGQTASVAFDSHEKISKRDDMLQESQELQKLQKCATLCAALFANLEPNLHQLQLQEQQYQQQKSQASTIPFPTGGRGGA